MVTVAMSCALPSIRPTDNAKVMDTSGMAHKAMAHNVEAFTNA